MPSPRVTVVIATYNWSSVLPFSIGSVMQQTFADFELLVVGDGCTDDSEKVVAAAGDARVRWINLPRNTGNQSGPNNEGVRQARGEIIAYLGHDDLWLPHHLSVLVDAIDRGAEIAAGIVLAVLPDGATIPLLIGERFCGDWMPPTGTVQRRAAVVQVGGWRDYRDIDISPETDLLLRMRAAGARLEFVPRLTAVKFPASTRKNVYRERPSHEQAEWLQRISTEPDFEVLQLARLVADERWPLRMGYRELVRIFSHETARRLMARLRNPLLRRKGRAIDAAKRFKGVEPNC